MLASFLFSLLAGFLTTRAEPLLEPLIEKVAKVDLRLDALESRVLTFGLMLLLAAIATALVGGNSSAYLAVSGGLLGYFGADLYAFARDPDKAMGEDEDDWDGGLAEPGERRTMAAHAPQPPAEADDRAGDEDDDEQTLRAVQDAVQQEPQTQDDKEPDR